MDAVTVFLLLLALLSSRCLLTNSIERQSDWNSKIYNNNRTGWGIGSDLTPPPQSFFQLNCRFTFYHPTVYEEPLLVPSRIGNFRCLVIALDSLH